MPSIQAFVQPFLAKVALKVLTASCSEGETAPRRTISGRDEFGTMPLLRKT